jgi:hypothetical protein
LPSSNKPRGHSKGGGRSGSPGPRVYGQHVFHSGYERAVSLGRDHPLLSAMGLESVFLCVRPIVLSTGAIANVEFHDLVF